MRSEVYDWLKKVDPATKLSNYEMLKDIAGTRAKEDSMDKPRDEQHQREPTEIACINYEGRFLEKAAAEKRKSKQLRSLIDGLPDSQRVLLRLQFIAYKDLSPEDIAYIARKTGISTDEVRIEINGLRTSIRESDRFKEYEKRKLLLISLGLKEENLERKLCFGRDRLQALGCNNLEEIEGDIEDLTLKNITENIKAMKEQLSGRFREREGRAIELCYLDYEKFRHKEVLKRLQITRRKREKILTAYKSGKYFVWPHYKRMAAILGIKEGTIGSRKNRTKEALLKGLAGLRKK
jgi:DNA-directed RNA polymerase specialized sigma24 family protein